MWLNFRFFKNLWHAPQPTSQGVVFSPIPMNNFTLSANWLELKFPSIRCQVEIVVHVITPHSEICIVSQKPKFPTSWSFRKQLSRGSCSLFKRHQEITRLYFPLTLDNGEWQEHRTARRFKAKGNFCRQWLCLVLSSCQQMTMITYWMSRFSS